MEEISCFEKRVQLLQQLRDQLEQVERIQRQAKR